jgi:hypothetical protein
MTESVKSTVFGIKRSSLSKTIDFTSPMRRFYGFVLSVPKFGEFRPKFLRANLNCADSPISNKFRPKKNYCVCTRPEYHSLERGF